MSVASMRRQARRKRQVRVRRKIRGTEGLPRLCVFRSARHIYAQIIEDTTGRTLAAASTVSKDLKGQANHGGNAEAAKAVGASIARIALERDIKQVVFDRNGFLYHGRVKALAEAARESGLSF